MTVFAISLKIGIISDSFNALGGMDKNIECGYLPPDIEILQDDSGTDEGRGMAQVVHASAKNAKIAFYAPDGSLADFANGIQALYEAGVDVIADDLGTPGEPFFQWGPVATAANAVARDHGIPYFSAIGNNAGGSWAGGPYQAGPCPDWVPEGRATSCHVFENGKNFQKIELLRSTDALQFEFQFASPSKNSGPVRANAS